MKNTALFALIGVSIAVPAFAGNPESGLNVGQNVIAFHPYHVAGPDKGTDTCPP
ncbi:hypothetical protein QPK87_20070 [Kamptonema cortianum]|nr:hypothetical protein [Geitlerinema splendidum]MDK3158856.1 hypothetical protein [Kamptonema cortianum]